MKTEDALDYFDGPQKMARALSAEGWLITSSAVSQWPDYPPMGRQFQIQTITDGELQVGEHDNG